MGELKEGRIKCPYCGAILKVNLNAPGIVNKQLICPVCKEKSPFLKFILQQDKEKEETDYRDCNTERIHLKSEEISSIRLGKIRLLSNSLEFPLKEGRNIVGRLASSSSATIQIPMHEGRRLSREHLVIDVKRIPDEGYKYVASLYKEHINATFINHEKLEYGDRVVLRNGDVISLPDVTIVFECE